MKHVTATLVGLLFAFGLLVAGSSSSWAGEATPAATPLDRLLPADTFLFASADARALREGLPQLDIAGLLREPEMRQFLKPLLQQLPHDVGDDPVQAAVDMNPLNEWLRGELAFGFSGFSVTVVGTDGKRVRHRLSPSHPLDSRVLHQLLGASVETARLVEGNRSTSHEAMQISVDFLLSVEPGPALRQMVEQHLAAIPGSQIDKVTLAGHEITRLTLSSAGGPSTSVYADLSGDRWLVGGDADTLTHAIAGDQREPLASNEHYAKVRGRIATGRNVAFAYVNLAAALAIAKPLVPPILMDELNLFGLDQFQGAALAMGITEGSVRESLLLSLDGQARGIMRLLECFGQGFPSLQDAPASTVAFAGLRLDVERLRQGLMAFSQDVLPGSLGEIQEAMKHLDISGVSLNDTILPSFGDELSLTVSPSTRSFIPDVVLQVALRDAAKFAQVLDLLKQFAGEHFGLQSFPITGGSDGFIVRAEHAEVEPAFAVRDNRLYGAVLGALSLKSYLASHVANPAHETLGKASDTLAKVLRGLTGGAHQPGLLVYLDLKRSLPVAYQSAAPMLPQVLSQSGTGLDPAYLPLAETLASHFTGAAMGITRGPEGVSFDLFTPTGLLPLVMAAHMIEHHQVRVPPPRQTVRRIVQADGASEPAAAKN